MNKILHAVILVVFGASCWFLALMLKLPLMVQPATARLPSVPPGQAVLPGFTRLCMAAGPILLGVFALASLAYCIYVWVRKAERPASWPAFLATTMSALVLVLLPTVVAIYIPLVDFLNRSTAALPKKQTIAQTRVTPSQEPTLFLPSSLTLSLSEPPREATPVATNSSHWDYPLVFEVHAPSPSRGSDPFPLQYPQTSYRPEYLIDTR